MLYSCTDMATVGVKGLICIIIYNVFGMTDLGLHWSLTDADATIYCWRRARLVISSHRDDTLLRNKFAQTSLF